MARFNRWSRAVHRIAAYIVGLQVLVWILGGVTFAWLPFTSVVKGGAVLKDLPTASLPPDWRVQLASAEERIGTVTGLASHDSAQGPLLQLQSRSGEHWLRLEDGALDAKPTADQVRDYAATLYSGDGVAGDARYLAAGEPRMFGLVDELNGRTQVWQVPFDDVFRTRLYFDSATGRYMTIRNDFWVFYDAMWRLHIMDYGDGEDFNNPLLKIFAALSLAFVVSGFILVYFALRRLLR